MDKDLAVDFAIVSFGIGVIGILIGWEPLTWKGLIAILLLMWSNNICTSIRNK